ncbi:Sua5/YciO/YrdC/YwlC family protein, partial [Klebsiella pneumoniae]
MRRWTIDPNTRNWMASPEFTAAVRDLSDGHLVAVPTETVYGLAADATSNAACAAIFTAKGRPRFNPL